jgi:two-component system OmpR family sensor kinase
VSHDLRTPLARIRFGIDTLQEENDPILRRQFEQKISNNVDEMTSLVETLLSYARLDQTMVQMNKTSCDLLALVENCIRVKSSGNKKITLVAPNEDYCVYADSGYLTILINNLLENALNYGKDKINIQLKALKNSVEMVVEDDGDGIDHKIRASIFKPFVRGTNYQKSIKGHGIGLAIVKRIIDWHTGSIDISDSETLEGAKFTITLPKR